jgi:beta-fructofuranosidase
VWPPLSEPTGRFGQQEVVSLARVEGRWVLVFSCLSDEIPGAAPGDGGVWCVPVDGPGSPVDVDAAVRLTGEELYVGRVVDGPAGPAFLAFCNTDPQGAFVGGVIDPVPVTWRPDGRGLVLGLTPVVG